MIRRVVNRRDVVIGVIMMSAAVTPAVRVATPLAASACSWC